MLGRVVRPLAFALFLSTTFLSTTFLSTGSLSAQTLALPDNLTDLNSAQGEQFFSESGALPTYFAVADNFVTQKTQAYCGVASMVMVLNALHVPAPSTPAYEPYHIFTQDNVLDEHTDAILPRELLARQGMTLDQLGALLALHPARIEVHHAADGGLDAFRASARDYLATPGHFVIVNYLRKALGQKTGGHISPLAAYDAKADRIPYSRCRPLQISAGLGDGFRLVRGHEHAGRGRRQQDARLRAARQGHDAIAGRRVLARSSALEKHASHVHQAGGDDGAVGDVVVDLLGG